MSDSNEKSKELLRQAELRIKGILEFSSELDNKIFKLLASTIALSSALAFFLINQHSTFTNKNLLFSLIFALGIISFVTIFLLMAIKPSKYKGLGLPLSEFDDEKSLYEIIQRAKDRYDTRFNRNRALNDKKSKWLKSSITLLFLMPIVTGGFYLTLKSLCAPVVVIVVFWIIFTFCTHFITKKYIV